MGRSHRHMGSNTKVTALRIERQVGLISLWEVLQDAPEDFFGVCGEPLLEREEVLA